MRSFRCCGRRPSGPPAEPDGKDRTALLTSLSETARWPVLVGIGNEELSKDPGGCFAWRLRKLSNDGTAGLSSLLRMRIAALILPSSNLAVTAWASCSEAEIDWPPSFLWNGSRFDSMVSLENSSMRFLMVAVRLWRFPPLLGGKRTEPLQLNNE